MSAVAIGTAVVGIGTAIYNKDQASIAQKKDAVLQTQLAAAEISKQAEIAKQMQIAAGAAASTGIKTEAELLKKKERDERIIIISSIIGATILVLGTGAYFIFRRKKVKE